MIINISTEPATYMEDGLYHPMMRLYWDDELLNTKQYVMGFEDEATALVMARSFARDELAAVVDGITKHLNNMK